MNMADIKQAEDTLTNLVRTFRAASGLLETLETLKEGVKFVSTLDEKKSIAQAELDRVMGELAKAKDALYQAELGKAKADKAVAAIQEQLKNVRL